MKFRRKNTRSSGFCVSVAEFLAFKNAVINAFDQSLGKTSGRAPDGVANTFRLWFGWFYRGDCLHFRFTLSKPRRHLKPAIHDVFIA